MSDNFNDRECQYGFRPESENLVRNTDFKYCATTMLDYKKAVSPIVVVLTNLTKLGVPVSLAKLI